MILKRIQNEVTQELQGQGIAATDIRFREVLHLRYDGTDTALPVTLQDGSFDTALKDFQSAHKAQFGFIYPDKPVVIEAAEVEGEDSKAAVSQAQEEDKDGSGSFKPDDSCRIFSGGPGPAPPSPAAKI